ncbi:hypothetical protein ILYODFUR_026578 [Ilyodon furcidens]|uniref:Uncharacterized protein n=1 Tax=Ilyodon furcidens TaxID=33524 RepID=A0ABV0UAL0_9TELE
MELFFNPFDNLLCILLGISFTVWFTLLLVFIIVPAIFGVSFGIRRLYMKTLLKIFEVRACCLLIYFCLSRNPSVYLQLSDAAVIKDEKNSAHTKLIYLKAFC